MDVSDTRAGGKVDRRTVDLSAYPDLVVIYLGMRVNVLGGLKTLLGMGKQIGDSAAARPDGLLLHEPLVYSLMPMHLGMRQYWRDFDSLERWARSEPHRIWWQRYLRDTDGTGFWHEAYFMKGGMEAVYVSMPQNIGFSKFAPVMPARGRMFSARERARREGPVAAESPLPEHELYG